MATSRKLGPWQRFRRTRQMNNQLDQLVATHLPSGQRPGTAELAKTVRSPRSLMELATQLFDSGNFAELFEEFTELNISGRRARCHKVRDSIRRAHTMAVSEQMDRVPVLA